MKVGWLFIAGAIYEALAGAFRWVLISHVRGVWRVVVVTLFGIFAGHVVVQWAHDDLEARRDELAAASAREWRW